MAKNAQRVELPTADRPRCLTCRFWDPDGGMYEDGEVLGFDDDCKGRYGECRRRAPVLILAQDPIRMKRRYTVHSTGQYNEPDDDETSRAIWPITCNNNWCGEHEPSEQPRPPVKGKIQQALEQAGFDTTD